MNEYLLKISGESDFFGSEYLADISKQPDILERSSNGYYALLTRKGTRILAVALSTPEIERSLSVRLAGKLNVNSSPEDRAVDFEYNVNRTGGSALHHNLDGSHTFMGALEAIRKHSPDTPESEVWLNALEHLARDFTTPSGINPFLEPADFRAAKDFLTDLGLSSGLSNDFLNLNAVEIGLGVISGSSIIFGMSRPRSQLMVQQVSRLIATFFFSGNLLCLLVATGLLVRMVVGTEIYNQDPIADIAKGAGQIVLASALLPSLPLSVSIIIGTAACAAAHYAFVSQYQIALEMEQVFRTQFPSYRSYLSSI